MRGDTCIERWMKPAIRTEGPKPMTTALSKMTLAGSGKSHFKSRLFKKAISAELTSSAFSCCVQCPQSGKMIIC